MSRSRLGFFRFVFFFLAFLQSQLEALDSQLFRQKLKEPTPEWMTEQIEGDLKPFQKQLSKKSLDEIFVKLKDQMLLFRVRVANNRLVIEASEEAKKDWRCRRLVSSLFSLQGVTPLPDIDFLVTCHDVFGREEPETSVIQGNSVTIISMPIFIIAKPKQYPGMILIPDWYAVNDFHPDKAEILKGNQKYDWNSKIPLLFFRGADSGVGGDRSNWRKFSRPKLVAYSLEYPELIDARFNTLLTYEQNSSIRDQMVKEGMMGKSVPLREFSRYRYLADVDGHTANTPRVALLLHSNSVMMKQVTDNMLWFYGALKPNVHFIPVKQDLSDLVSQIEWAKNHENECREIIKNANQFASKALSAEAIYLYIYRLLEAYSSKQRKYYKG